MFRAAVIVGFLASAVWGQPGPRGNPPVGNINRVPLFNSRYGVLRVGRWLPQQYTAQYNSAYSSFYGGYLWGAYWNRPAAQIPERTYANPAKVEPAVQVAVIEAPPIAIANASSERAEAQSSFQSAAGTVAAARQTVEDLRARLAAIGQSPRANLITGAANAEAALGLAKQQLAAGNVAAAQAEIKRADYMARQILKEFGR